ncbi:helix-turn-helix domain-containing protein [Roseovarius sp. EL26]|uniref:helix-turn-helix domain-containing protein n=1 Tax=Roseovarius sp. EL26 TaxID=2126672 RepID=UPI000EA03E72
MQRDEIKAELSRRGISLRQIAKELSVSPPSISIVLKGDRRSKRIENAIAQKIGRTAECLWPERYQTKKGKQ